MADLTLRRNEKCIIGLPACGYVFNSTRSCFIGYGFRTSPFEVEILKRLLKERLIEVNEAGGSIEAGSLAFCTKICSKIITSQFCIILVNLDSIDGRLIPNANVNLEYGMMLGFNKYVIPFQDEKHPLPFNTQGLDTIKYNSQDFTRKATDAIEKAINDTDVKRHETFPLDNLVKNLLVSRDLVVSPTAEAGERLIANMANSFGYVLCNTLHGQHYIFLGIFSDLRTDAVLLRLDKALSTVRWMVNNLDMRAKTGLIRTDDINLLRGIITSTEIILIVAGLPQKTGVEEYILDTKFPLNVNVMTVEELELIA
jgi:hypothetical protein